MLKKIILSIALGLQLCPQHILADAQQAQQTAPQHNCSIFVNPPCSTCGNLGSDWKQYNCCPTTYVCAECNAPHTREEADNKRLAHRSGDYTKDQYEIEIHQETIRILQQDPSKTYAETRADVKKASLEKLKKAMADKMLEIQKEHALRAIQRDNPSLTGNEASALFNKATNDERAAWVKKEMQWLNVYKKLEDDNKKQRDQNREDQNLIQMILIADPALSLNTAKAVLAQATPQERAEWKVQYDQYIQQQQILMAKLNELMFEQNINEIKRTKHLNAILREMKTPKFDEAVRILAQSTPEQQDAWERSQDAWQDAEWQKQDAQWQQQAQVGIMVNMVVTCAVYYGIYTYVRWLFS